MTAVKIPIVVVVLIAICGSTLGQNLPAEPGEAEEDHLAREVEDLTAILTQLQFQDQYNPKNFQLCPPKT